MTEATPTLNLYQQPSGDARWRLWLLIDWFTEISAAAQKADMWQPSLREPRGQWALDNKARDPFAGAVWNIDQVLRTDRRLDPWPGVFLDDAEVCVVAAEQRVVAHNRSLRLRETPRYQEVHARICHLMDLEVEISKVMWEGNVQVRDCPFDDELYSLLRKKAIERIEDDDLDAAERYCQIAERVLAGEQSGMELR